MSNVTDIDVIIPAWNAAATIRETLESVLSQTHPAKNIFVVDDASTDDTVAIVQSFPDARVKILKHPINKGVSAARNTGIRAATSSFIAFVDADDIWLSYKLEKQMAVFNSTDIENCVCVYCDYTAVDTDGKSIKKILYKHLRGDLSRILAFGNLILGSSSALVIRKDAIDRAGFFDETLVDGEDWDYWMRLSVLGSFDLAPEELVKIRYHNASRQLHHRISDMARVWRNHLIALARHDENGKVPARAYWPYYRVILFDAVKKTGSWDLSKALEPYRTDNARFARPSAMTKLIAYGQTGLKLVKAALI